LQRDQRRRWRDIGDVRLELEEADGTVVDAPLGGGRRITTGRERLLWSAGLVAAAIVMALVARSLTTKDVDTSTSAGVFRFEIGPAPGTALYPGGWIVPFALSPNGRWIAYTAISDDGASRLWVRGFDAVTAQPVADSEGATAPFWSPDSAWVGFRTVGTLYRVRVPGGTPEVVTNIPGFYIGGANPDWGRDLILFPGPGGNLMRVSPQGGQPQPATTLDGAQEEISHAWPQFLSNGRDFLYLVNTPNRVRVLKQSVDSGARELVTEFASRTTLRYAGHHLFFVENGVMWAQGFDENAGRVTGDRRRIAAGVPVGGPGAAPFSVSDSAIAYWTRPLIQQASELLWFDRQGKPIATAGAKAIYDGFDLSRDDARLVSAEVGGDGSAIWVQDLLTRGRFPVRLDASGTVPLWAPDGRHIAMLYRRVIATTNVDTAGDTATALTAQAQNQLPQDWTADGSQLLYENWTADDASDLMTVDVTTKQVSRLPFNTKANEFAGRLSPDNHWLLYVTDQTGRPEVWIASYPAGERRRQLSTAGGTHPEWRRDGREVYFIAGDGQLVATTIRISLSDVSVGSSSTLFRIPRTIDLAAGSHNMYKPGADGRRFIVSVGTDRANVPPLSMILNWGQLLLSP